MINYGISLVTLICTGFIYPQLPAEIPTQWGFDGYVNYGPKRTIWLIAGMLILFSFMFDYLPRVDPRKKNYQKFGAVYDYFCVGMQIFLAITVGIIISESFYPGRINAGKIVLLMISILFLCIGNFMPKIQSNFFMGIKTPWTLSNEDVWRKTHRLGGKLYVGCGIITLLSALFLPMQIAVGILMALVFCSTGAVCLASYLWWRRMEKGN